MCKNETDRQGKGGRLLRAQSCGACGVGDEDESRGTPGPRIRQSRPPPKCDEMPSVPPKTRLEDLGDNENDKING